MRALLAALSGWQVQPVTIFLVWLSLQLSPGDASAATSLSERKTTFRRPVNGTPSLTASGDHAVGSWQALGDSSGVEVDVSLSGGTSWMLGTQLVSAPPAPGVTPPTAGYLTTDDVVHLVTDHLGGVKYFRSFGIDPLSWSTNTFPSSYPLGVYSPYLDGYDLHSVGANPDVGRVYMSATENTSDGSYSSTVLFSKSLDNGTTWGYQTPLRLSSPYSKGSSMVVGPDGTIFAAWVDYSLSKAMFCRSGDHGDSFGPSMAVGDVLDNLTVMPIGLELPRYPYRNYPWYLSYRFAPNFPALAVDRSAGPTRGNLYMVWADHADGDIAPSTQTLFEDEQAHDTPEAAQLMPLDCEFYGGVETVEGGTDPWDYYALDLSAGQTIWLDGMAFNETIGCAVWMEKPGGGLELVGSLRLMYPIDIPANGRPKAMIYTAPRTGRFFLQVATAFFGSGYLINVRNYTPKLASAARDMRDIVLVRSTDGGLTWSPKVRVNHDPPGHDQCMPNVAVDDHGKVYVAWYDRRDAAAGDSVWAYASVSTDGGLSFGSDLKLSSRGSSWVGAQSPYGFVKPGDIVGDRIAIAAGDDYGLVAWPDFRDWPTRSDIYTARIVDTPTSTDAVSDLEAVPATHGVRLRWLVNDWRSLAGLRLHRSGEDGVESPMGDEDMVPTHSGSFEHVDTSVEPEREYRYRLQVRGAGGVRWLGPVSVSVPARITTLACRAAGPNPFERTMSLRLAVPQSAAGSVRVYDVQGKAVRTLAEGTFEPGERTLEWDGRDASGAQAAPGIYFVSAEVGGGHANLRVVRVR